MNSFNTFGDLLPLTNNPELPWPESELGDETLDIGPSLRSDIERENMLMEIARNAVAVVRAKVLSKKVK